MTNLISKKIIITGTVQGVGYRRWLQKICNDNGVIGWVANKKDGDVEAFFLKWVAKYLKIFYQSVFWDQKILVSLISLLTILKRK